MQLHFQEYGRGEPLIVLHGLFGSSDNWHSVSRQLSSMFHVFALDQRNHGRSPHSHDMSYPVMAVDVLEFVTNRRLERPILLGHSMGGKTAMEVALSQPTIVSKLVVADIAPKSYPARHDHILEGLLSLKLTAFHDRNDVEEALAPTIPDLAVRRFLLKSMRRGDTGFEWQIGLQEIAANYEAINAGLLPNRTFSGPTLFLRGEHSDYVSEDDLAPIQRLFPAAVFEILPGAGHWLHAEAATLFIAAVKRFLSDANF